MSDLLSKDSVCGKTLLNIVGHGNSIIAEIQRLSLHIPKYFELEKHPHFPESALYQHIIIDFRYQENRKKYDETIQKSSELLTLDESFIENYLPVIERFFSLFLNVYKYSEEIKKFLKDLDEGVVFVDQNLEKLFKDLNGKQLLCEMVYLYGCMLLIMDKKIDGVVRERILMSYYRYKTVSDIDQSQFLKVCNLCARTQVRIKKKVMDYPPDYPLDYFARVKFNDEFLDLIISKLRTDDVYNQTSYYPFHHHRTTALATQSGILYVMLFFKPSILKNQSAAMRSIVDNLFCDNWVISYYMGFTVDLSVEWQKFKAAKQAINNIVEPNVAKDLVTKHSRDVLKHLKDLKKVLTEGVITEEYVLDNIEKQLKIIRRCNITLRWLLLHRKSRIKKIQQVILENSAEEKILLLLLNVGQFEFILQKMFTEMLEVKEKNWTDAKEDAKKRMKELSSYFAGDQLSSIKDEQLQEWFLEIEKSIELITYDNPLQAGNKLHEIITALKDVEEFKNVYNSLQVKQFLDETRKLLRKMIRYVNIQHEVLFQISILSDISYGWKIINDYVPLMQQKIVKNPGLIVKLRSTFLKCASMMEVPCVRIKDAGVSSDLESVSKYYSKELVDFVRKVLEIIPISMFEIVNKVISIHSNTLNQLPIKFNRDELKKLAQLKIRDELSKYTYKISEFTEGVLAMNRTLFGIIEVDPKQLLEDGVRKELVKQISESLENYLIFKPKTKIEEFEKQLHKLSVKLNGMCRSFEYIQDYILVYGLKVWQEEFTRIINYNVEMECNRSLKNKVMDYQSRYQNSVIPIPTYNSGDKYTNNFMGRIVRELLVQTDPRKFTYIEKLSGWFDEKGKENLGNKHFFLLEKSIGVQGLRGIDIIISFGIVKLMDRFAKLFDKGILDNKKLVDILTRTREGIEPFTSFRKDLHKTYMQIIPKFSKIFSSFAELVVKIGRSQLLRKHILYSLNFSCKLNANLLYKSLDAMNMSIISEVNENERKQQKKISPTVLDQDLNPLMAELDSYLEQSGLSIPYEKVYYTRMPLQNFGFIMGLFLLSQIPKFVYDANHYTYVKKNKKKKEVVDGLPFVVGMITLFRQFHLDEKINFFSVLSQYIKSFSDKIMDPKTNLMNENVKFILRFIVWYCKFDNIPVKKIRKFYPRFWFANLE